MSNTPLVSIVVPAYNCSKTISKTIESLLSQTAKNLEIIIIDDGSTDETAKCIQSYDNIFYFYQKNEGPASARNRGAQKSSGDFIFFTDSDCIAKSDWIEEALKRFDDPQVAVVAGSYGIANKESMLARCIHDEIMYRHQKLMGCYPKAFGSYNFGVRKKTFELVDGFNQFYRCASGEDNDLSYKILKTGKKIYFERQSIVYHHHPVRVRKYLREQYRHGFWRVMIYVDHPDMVQGDDYTFWKDIVEVPLAFAIMMFLLVQVFFSFSIGMNILIFLIVFLLLLEAIFSFLMIKQSKDILLNIWVVFLRSFARALGFSSGILRFVLFRKGKKVK